MSDLFGTTLLSLRDTRRKWTFLRLAVKAELKASCFAGSWLSVMWWILEPLLLMFVYLLVVEVLRGRQVQYGALFVFTTILPYRWFSMAMARSTPILITSAGLIKSVAFPKLMMPLGAVIANTIHFLFGCVILALMLLTYHVHLTAWALCFPVVVVIQFIFTFGVALFAAAATVFVRDVQGVVPFMLRLLLFVSPIFYDIEAVPERWHGLYMLNPLSPLLTSYKNILLYQRAPTFGSLAYVLGLGLTLVVAGIVMYSRIDRKFAHWI